MRLPQARFEMESHDPIPDMPIPEELPVNLGLLNVLLKGALFEVGDVELAGIRNDISINRLIVQIGFSSEPVGAAQGGTQGSAPAVAGQPEGVGMDLPGHPAESPTPVEPPEVFTVDTTLVFDRAAIGQVESLYLRYLRLVVLHDEPRSLNLGVAPRCEIAFTDRPVVTESHDWIVAGKLRRRAIPKMFRERPVKATGAKLVSQAFTASGKRSLSIYRLPLDRSVLLAGQKYLFDAGVFESVHLAVARKEGRDNPGPRHLVLMVRPAVDPGHERT